MPYVVTLTEASVRQESGSSYTDIIKCFFSPSSLKKEDEESGKNWEIIVSRFTTIGIYTAKYEMDV